MATQRKAPDPNQIIRAYSLFEVKSIDDPKDDKRKFTGIATTPSVDRMGDIVEPEGAEFKLPIPFLWQHNSSDPIGWVTSAKVAKTGITIEGEIAAINEPASLKDRLDTAWAMIAGKLVRGLSIGFKPLESARIGDSWSYRFLKWSWLELSAVTIPANADASLTGIKAADLAMRKSVFGPEAHGGIVYLDNVPRVRGAANDESRIKGVVYL